MLALGAEIGFPVDDIAFFDIGIEREVGVVIGDDLSGPTGHDVIVFRDVEFAQAAENGHEAFVEGKDLLKNGDLFVERFVETDEFIHGSIITLLRGLRGWLFACCPVSYRRAFGLDFAKG